MYLFKYKMTPSTFCNLQYSEDTYSENEAWGGVVVKALRY
jgi:hypothetical protein